jgi:cold-inducible RNA-binding protein
MAKKLFVAGIASDATEDQVREMFSPYGNIVSVFMVTDRFTGNVRFAFVEFETEEEAQAAKTALANQDVNGKKLTVDEARPPRERDDRGPRQDRGGFGGGSYGGSHSGGGNNYRSDRR